MAQNLRQKPSQPPILQPREPSAAFDRIHATSQACMSAYEWVSRVYTQDVPRQPRVLRHVFEQTADGTPGFRTRHSVSSIFAEAIAALRPISRSPVLHDSFMRSTASNGTPCRQWSERPTRHGGGRA
ncbi:hypothetical protein MRX96_018916 [Rhipicephalus microplus]